MSTGSGSFMFLGGDAESPPTPIRELYAVFRRSTRPSDLYVQQLAIRDAHGALEEETDTPADIRLAFRAQIGTPLYEDARLLVGTASRGIYAVPTTAEVICLGSFPDGGGSCGRPGPHGVRVAFDDASDGSPFLLYGIVGDDVAGLEVVAGNQRLEPELGENGYLLELAESRRHDLQELVLHLHGGATDVLPLRSRPQLE